MYAAIAIVSLLASFLTFFSGFGLGTLLLPVFAVFFDLPTSILLTACVHFLNNIFKLFMVAKKININVFVRFGIPSFLAAFVGAFCLHLFSTPFTIERYHLGGMVFSISLQGLIIGTLMLFFALWEIIPFLKKLSFGAGHLLTGGLISGFFGGLSGHQGALRSAFLIRMNLEKETFIATGIGIACLVDVARMAVYSSGLKAGLITGNSLLLLIAVVAAWTGAVAGKILVKKTTYTFVKWCVAIFMLLISLGVMTGLLSH